MIYCRRRALRYNALVAGGSHLIIRNLFEGLDAHLAVQVQATHSTFLQTIPANMIVIAWYHNRRQRLCGSIICCWPRILRILILEIWNESWMRVTALDGRMGLHNTLGQKYYKRRSDWHFRGKPQSELSLLRSILNERSRAFQRRH